MPEAKQSPENRALYSAHGSPLRLLAGLGVLALAGASVAQTTRIEPSIQLRQTYTDNVTAADASDKRSDWITEVTPSIAVRRESGRLNGFANAQFRNLAYADSSEDNATFLAFSGRGVFEAVEDMLFLDANGSVSRDNGSLLTGRGAGDDLDVDKQNETRTASFGPRLHFRPFGQAEGLLRYEHRWFDGNGDIARRQKDKVEITLGESEAYGRIGWGLGYRGEETRYEDIASNEVRRETMAVSLYYSVSPQLRLQAGGGREINRFEGQDRRTDNILVAGLEWAASPRTKLSATVEDRFFGTAYKMAFDHRRARSAWSLLAQRTVASSLDDVPGLSEDVLYNQYFDALGSIGDPVERDLEARRLAQENAFSAQDRFITNNYFLSQTFRGSVTLIGKRDALTLSANQARRSRLGQVLVFDGRDDFATYDLVRTRSVSAALAHKFTHVTNGNLTIARSRAEGTGSTSAETDRTQLSVALTTRLGPHTTGGVRYRYQRADGTGDAADYTENEVSASLGIRF